MENDIASDLADSQSLFIERLGVTKKEQYFKGQLPESDGIFRFMILSPDANQFLFIVHEDSIQVFMDYTYQNVIMRLGHYFQETGSSNYDRVMITRDVLGVLERRIRKEEGDESINSDLLNLPLDEY